MLLHSIVVQRALGEFQYSHADSELFELSYARCNSQPVAHRVDERAEAFAAALERAARPRVQISVSFFERRGRPASFALFRSEVLLLFARQPLSTRLRPAAPLPLSGEGRLGALEHPAQHSGAGILSPPGRFPHKTPPSGCPWCDHCSPSAARRLHRLRGRARETKNDARGAQPRRVPLPQRSQPVALRLTAAAGLRRSCDNGSSSFSPWRAAGRSTYLPPTVSAATRLGARQPSRLATRAVCGCGSPSRFARRFDISSDAAAETWTGSGAPLQYPHLALGISTRH